MIYEWTETASPKSFIYYTKARISQSICVPNEIHTETVWEWCRIIERKHLKGHVHLNNTYKFISYLTDNIGR